MNNDFDPTLSDLIEVPADAGDADVPDALLNLELPTGTPKGADQLMRQLENDALTEMLTGVPVPSRLHVGNALPLPGPMGTPANIDAAGDDTADIEALIRQIAEKALDSDEPSAVLDAIASADDGEGWRAKARRIDRYLLTKMVAQADEAGSEDAARVLRILEQA